MLSNSLLPGCQFTSSIIAASLIASQLATLPYCLSHVVPILNSAFLKPFTPSSTYTLASCLTFCEKIYVVKVPLLLSLISICWLEDGTITRGLVPKSPKTTPWEGNRNSAKQCVASREQVRLSVKTADLQCTCHVARASTLSGIVCTGTTR